MNQTIIISSNVELDQNKLLIRTTKKQKNCKCIKKTTKPEEITKPKSTIKDQARKKNVQHKATDSLCFPNTSSENENMDCDNLPQPVRQK